MQIVNYIKKINYKLFGKFIILDKTESYTETSRQDTDGITFKVSTDYFIQEFKLD